MLRNKALGLHSMLSTCTASKLQPVLNYTEVHALTLAVIFYALLGKEIEGEGKGGKGRVEEKEERKKGREVREGRREGGGQGGMRRREEGKGEMEGGATEYG